ncbi:MAG: low molecular weight protein-tyrosine-phosphatase [Kiloniellales bacterium]
MAASVLFVCTGNICRSPTAEGVMRHALAAAGLDGAVAVDSAGLGGWHVGEPPDGRAIRCAAQRGYDLSAQRARQFHQADFDDFPLILGMDRGHVRELRGLQPGDGKGNVSLFLDYLPAEDPHFGRDVPDPYYGGPPDYEISLDLIERGVPGLIAAIERDFL